MGSPQSSSSSIFYDFDDEIEDEIVSYMMQMETPPVPRPIIHRTQIERDRDAANRNLMNDYFSATPTYRSAKTFFNRFRMSKRMFLRILNDLEIEFPYFQQRCDARRKLGFTAIQKVTSALRVLAYGTTTDINDEYLKMAKKTTRDTLEHFAKGMRILYGPRYLRKSTWNDLQLLYDQHDKKYGLPGMIGSIDCKHWQWDNCPTAWKDQYTRGDQKGPTVILQAVASCDQWIWHAHFGVAGSNNNINVLQGSEIIEDYVSGKGAKASLYANGNYYPHGYLLGDGIYSEYSFIVKTYKDPIDEKRKRFKVVQEAARKGIECTFGTLVTKWHYVKNPCRLWTLDKMKDCMRSIIIMHNMVKEDRGMAICSHYNPQHQEVMPEASMEERVQNLADMRSRQQYNALMADLVEHMWSNRHEYTDVGVNNNDDDDDDDGDDGDDDDDDEYGHGSNNDDNGDDDEDEAYDDVQDDD
ncbi:hypothetical protein SSX86_033091 [Deinandra increscens subsp. villosa]|uniref:Harbinger transposase-derived protein n=1 Tax=Deinandra increscens subsp. villosa TaxID=3103831 RepID=A0AAP0C6J7_9ASTR